MNGLFIFSKLALSVLSGRHAGFLFELLHEINLAFYPHITAISATVLLSVTKSLLASAILAVITSS